MREIRATILPTAIIFSLVVHQGASTTLIREGRLVEVNRDDSDLTFGGLLSKTSAGFGCSWNTYYENCNDPGQNIWKDKINGPSYVLSGSKVTSCGRWRQEGTCNNCNRLGCTLTTPTSYGGSKITYDLRSHSTEIAELPVSGELPNACTGVCTDSASNSVLFAIDPRTQCQIAPGWSAVNDDFEEACAATQLCEELEIIQGCEGTSQTLTGMYQPLTDVASCSDDDVDKSRTVYYSDTTNMYLFYHKSQNKWLFNYFCNDLAPLRAYLDAGDEPYLDNDDSVDCYDGGYGSNKEYTWTDFEIRCNQ